LNALELSLHELKAVKVEIVFADPLALPFLEEVIIQLSVLYTTTLVLHHKDQASNHAALRHRVSYRLNQIPAQPWHTKDSVVAYAELECEPCCHRGKYLLLALSFYGLDLFMTNGELC